MTTVTAQTEKLLKNKRILLIRPPVVYLSNSRRPPIGLPLGLLYIGSVLEQEGYEVSLFDALLENNKYLLNLDMKDKGYLGCDWDYLEKEIVRRKPDIVGITNQFTTQITNAIKTAEIVKKIDSRITTIVGGPHASIAPGDFFEKTNTIDIVVRGEGEQVVSAVVEQFDIKDKQNLYDIKGIGFKDKDKVILNPGNDLIENLDTLPFPAYHLLDMEKYFYTVRANSSGRPMYRYPGSERAISMITSRGCPYSCIFCSIHLHMGKRWRHHSCEYVSRHIAYVIEKYGVRHIDFEDDNLTFNLPRFERILDGLNGYKRRISWSTPNGIRADKIEKRLLLKAKENGCMYLIIGVESGDPDVLHNIVNKRLDLDKVKRIAKLCKNIKLDLEAFFIIGFPGEKKENIKRTLDFALMLEFRYDVGTYIFKATPLIGTELYKICREKGYLTKILTPQVLLIAMDEGIIKTEDFLPSDLKKFLTNFQMKKRITNILNLLEFLFKNPFTMIKLARNLSNLGNFNRFKYFVNRWNF